MILLTFTLMFRFIYRGVVLPLGFYRNSKKKTDEGKGYQTAYYTIFFK